MCIDATLGELDCKVGDLDSVFFLAWYLICQFEICSLTQSDF